MNTGWRALITCTSKAITDTAAFPTPAARICSLRSFRPDQIRSDQATVVPNVNVFESDNRSSYNGLMLHLQGNMQRFNLVANYTLSKAQTWGCLLGELFDYVDGVCHNNRPTECWIPECFRTWRLRPIW